MLRPSEGMVKPAVEIFALAWLFEQNLKSDTGRACYVNATEYKSGKQGFTLRGADLHATGRAKEIVFVHVELPDARRLIQSTENLIDNIADRQIRRIDKIQGTIFVTIINAAHTQTTEYFEFVFWCSDSWSDSATSE